MSRFLIRFILAFVLWGLSKLTYNEALQKEPEAQNTQEMSAIVILVVFFYGSMSINFQLFPSEMG